jgi:hypothetical protein
VVGLAFGIVLCCGAVRPVELLFPGENGPAATLIHRDFPSEEDFGDHNGYDGQQYYAIAVGLPDLDAAATSLDVPRYRLLRILAPAIGSLAPRGTATVLTLLVLNLIGMSMACGAVADMCSARQWPSAVGFVAAVPLAVAILTTCIDPLATGLTLTGLALVERHRLYAGGAALAAGALTREGAVIVVVAVALALVGTRRRSPRALVLLCAGAPIALWYWYLVGRTAEPVRRDWALLDSLNQPVPAALFSISCILVCAVGAVLWRHRPAIAATCGTTALQIMFYPEAVLDWAALPRVAAVGLSLSLAAVVACGLCRFGPPRSFPCTPVVDQSQI